MAYDATAHAYYIQNTAGVAAYGVIGRPVAYNEIGMQVNTYADKRMAANQLAIAAHAQLSRMATVQEAYTCRVVRAPSILVPGQTIRVVYHEWRDSVHVVDIDKVLYILEAQDEVGEDGIRTTGLTLATVDRWPFGSDDLGVEALEDGKIIAAYAQGTMAYSVSGPYIRRIDSTHDAEFTCKIGREVLDVQRATLRFQTRPLTSSVLSIGGSSDVNRGKQRFKTTDSTTAVRRKLSSAGTSHHHSVPVGDTHVGRYGARRRRWLAGQWRWRRQGSAPAPLHV